VVLVENLSGALEVEVILALGLPGQGDDPLEVGADDAVLGGGARQALEPSQLAIGGLACLLGQVGGLDALAQLLHLGLVGVRLAQLLLNRLQLLAQDELALALVELRLNLRLDLRLQLAHVDLAGEDARERAQALGDTGLLEQLLALGHGQPVQIGGDEVGEHARVVDVGERDRQLVGEVGLHLDDAGELRLDVAGECLDLVGDVDDVRRLLEPPDEIGLVADGPEQADAAHALNEQAQRPVGHLEHPRDGRLDADRVDVLPGGLLGVLRSHGDERHVPFAADDVVYELDRALLPDGQRHHRVGEDDGLLQRQQRQLETGARHRRLADACLLAARGAHGFDLSSIGTRTAPLGRLAMGKTICSRPRS